ncbi:AMP-binding protein [Sphingobium sp. EM0848]|uniref:AMP-binding protein n=1 Tax=Sphingobium sp. EM0848 TaxID=2743473 RepID=UPI00159C68A5|nr:AMP-binding protein [Sphingobium sp. EM0848]
MAILSMDCGGHGNAAEICNERFASDRERIALRHRGLSGETRDWTFADLKLRSSQFAHVLADLGVGKGDRVAGLLPRTPELLITMLAAWKLGAVYQPLFTAFGPKAIEYRLKTGETKVLVTDTVNRPKLTGLAVDTAIVTVGAGEDAQEPDFWGALNVMSDVFAPVPCAFEDPFLLMFTSGTTGLPKPLFVPIRAIAAFVGYMRDAVGLREGDRFWNLADPGWAYGLYYAVVGPLAMGITTVFQEASFTVDSTYDVIAECGITNLAGSPTAYRLMVGDGPEKAHRVKGQLKRVSSAGEPLNPEIIRWFEQLLEVAIYDHYGQTELGMVLCNHHGLKHSVHMGAAGYSVPGHRVVVLSPEGCELGPNEPGDLALDVPNSPLMWFKGYHRLETPAFQGSYFLTGDTAEINDDGSISFVGRADDVITTSGYRVGPFDVESALLEHSAVLESAVIGKPDPERTEIIKAFVVLKAGLKADEALSEELRQHVKGRLSAHAYPREIEFVDALPKTPSGKVQRFLLRSHERAKSSGPA